MRGVLFVSWDPHFGGNTRLFLLDRKSVGDPRLQWTATITAITTSTMPIHSVVLPVLSPFQVVELLWVRRSSTLIYAPYPWAISSHRPVPDCFGGALARAGGMTFFFLGNVCATLELLSV